MPVNPLARYPGLRPRRHGRGDGAGAAARPLPTTSRGSPARARPRARRDRDRAGPPRRSAGPRAPWPTTSTCSSTRGLFKVVRTQRVRAMNERYYGRVARTIYIGAPELGRGHRDGRQHRRHRDRVLRVSPRKGGRRPVRTLVHARIPVEDVRACGPRSRTSFAGSARSHGPETRSTASSPASTRPDAPTLPER